MEEKYNKYIEGTKKVLEDNKKDSSAYIINILNKKFLVLPNVFSPKYFNDTKIFASNIKINPGEDFLEIGPGTGVISIFAALNGAKSVTAIDINPQAVKNTKEGQLRYKADKGGIVHGRIGDISYSSEQIQQNIETLLEDLKKNKPASSKGVFIKKLSLSSTMGAGIEIDLSSLKI